MCQFIANVLGKNYLCGLWSCPTLTDACIMYHLTGPLGVTISDKQYFSATWTKLRGNESYFSYLIVFKQILH